ncbi:MAG: YbjN domain-containing protein [Candidatus Hydrogenedentes bacterium]|nr:YbjN domain-containing protein [Candidatus Hydrogenedentota bacterium]
MSNVTIELVKKYLERFGWAKYEVVDEPYEEEGVIYTGWRSSQDSKGYVVCIDPMIEKKCLSFRAEELIRCPAGQIPPSALLHLLLSLLWINYRIILGKFSYEPVSGEIRFSIDMPIDGADLTYEQFVHSLALFVEIVETYTPSLKLVGKGHMTIDEFIINDLNGERIIEGEGWSDSFKKFLDSLGGKSELN